ncbi:hypothetical protein O9993_03845 [Vibrio lentus]|nr:hypothetical protein [Vibrio lentus]
MTAKYGAKRRLAILGTAMMATSSATLQQKSQIYWSFGGRHWSIQCSAYDTFGLMGYRLPNIDNIAKKA